MPPKQSSPQRVIYRTIRAKEAAEKRAAERARRTTTATAAAMSPILEKVLEKWNELPASEKTPVNAVLMTAEACNRARMLTENPTYTGSVMLCEEMPWITQHVLELYVAMRAKSGNPISEDALERAVFPEYATNISFTEGILKVVTTKYVGMKVLPGAEAVLPCGEDGDETLCPCENLVDLLFNSLKLKLVTLKEIKEFVEQTVWVGARASMLSDKQVKKLVEKGIHEEFDESAIEDSTLVARDCAKLVDTLFPTSE